jgi:hypothetical protein
MPAAGRPALKPVIVLVMMGLRQQSIGRETLQMIPSSLCRRKFHACAKFETASPVSWTAGVPHSRTLKGPTMLLQCILHSSQDSPPQAVSGAPPRSAVR